MFQKFTCIDENSANEIQKVKYITGGVTQNNKHPENNFTHDIKITTKYLVINSYTIAYIDDKK